MGRAVLVTLVGLLTLGGCGGTSGAPGAAGASGGGAAGQGQAPGAAGSAGATGGSGGTGGSAGATGGAGGTAGTAGATGGIGGTAGTAGATGGSGGAAGTAGVSGSGGVVGCTFTVDASLSTAIPVVGIVTFTTDLANMSAAEIRFGVASGGLAMTAPVDLASPGHRTLLLGMKASTTYVFRIVATAATGMCTSADYLVTTGAAPSGIRNFPPTVYDAARRARGFIVVSALSRAFIIDADGAPVWWLPSSGPTTARAKMSWDGRDVYLVGMGPGNVQRISMDGLDLDRNVSGLTGAHHDLTAIPGGVAAMLEQSPGGVFTNLLVERSRDGTITTVANLGTLYPVRHSNSIHYYPWDDSYTVGDSGATAFVKITRKGDLVWQFGGANPNHPDKLFQGVTPWKVNHGHHLLADGTLAFMNNETGSMPIVRVFKLDTTALTATSLLAYQPSDARSMFLGDVQHLPNGDFLVTYMDGGPIREIDPSGQVVAQFPVGGSLGYSEFRGSLYGPPLY